MNILLLGNGYDLNYMLPTSYRNFLLTVDFLTKQNLERIYTIGNVFGDETLMDQDEFIKDSYELYEDVYNVILLDRDELKKIVTLAKDNIWFSYFLKSFNKDIGWIDFEKEISFVISCFQSFFGRADVMFLPNKACEGNGIKYIIMNAFNFFIDNRDHSHNGLTIGAKYIAPEYRIECPLNSGNYSIDKEKIIRVLSDALDDFNLILKTYLRCFIESTVKKLGEEKINQLCALRYTDVAITFNYTNTYESLDADTQVFHIHGNVNDRIVLGVNPDKNDNLETMDTSFVAFKKYYQRTFYDTDIPYLRWLREIRDEGHSDSDVHLLIMGHSLDVTDADIIRELFHISSEITILYHNKPSKAKYIQNLITIFGKEHFDQIRDELHLEFLPLDMDFTDFSYKRAENSTLLYETKIESLL